MFTTDNVFVLIAFLGYFALVLIIGFYFSKKSKTLSDYIIGDRSLNPWVAAISAQASDMSGWLLMGLPGAIYLSGLSEAWIGIGLAIGSYLAWLIAAKRLRNYSYVSGNAITLPEFFSNRFKDNKGILKLISAIVILVFFTFYVASGFVSCGNVFRVIFPGVSYYTAVLIGAVVIVVYTFLGGFKAVCWTDFFQGMLMIVAVVIVPLAAVGQLGGVDEAVEAANNIGAGFKDLFTDIDGNALSAIAVISSLAWGLGYFGMPHILVRYMAIKDPKEIKTSRRIATVWIVIALAAACLIGLVGRIYLPEGMYTDAAGAQNVFIAMAGQLFPPVIAGILFSALMAAVMSTADSQLLVTASAVTNDIIKQVSKKEIDDKKLMWISRWIVIVVAIIGAVIAYDENSSIMDLVSYAWAGFGAAFGPVVLLCLFWKRATLKGALAGMLVGFVIVIVWSNFLAAPTGLYELVPGFALALVVNIIVSLADKKPSKEIEEEFEKARSLD